MAETTTTAYPTFWDLPIDLQVEVVKNMNMMTYLPLLQIPEFEHIVVEAFPRDNIVITDAGSFKTYGMHGLYSLSDGVSYFKYNSILYPSKEYNIFEKYMQTHTLPRKIHKLIIDEYIVYTTPTDDNVKFLEEYFKELTTWKENFEYISELVLYNQCDIPWSKLKNLIVYYMSGQVSCYLPGEGHELFYKCITSMTRDSINFSNFADGNSDFFTDGLDSILKYRNFVYDDDNNFVTFQNVLKELSLSYAFYDLITTHENGYPELVAGEITKKYDFHLLNKFTKLEKLNLLTNICSRFKEGFSLNDTLNQIQTLKELNIATYSDKYLTLDLPHLKKLKLGIFANGCFEVLDMKQLTALEEFEIDYSYEEIPGEPLIPAPLNIIHFPYDSIQSMNLFPKFAWNECTVDNLFSSDVVYPELKDLSLTDISFTQLPEFSVNCPVLQSLAIEIESFKDSFKIQDCILSSIYRLHLFGQITSNDLDFSVLPNLTELCIISNFETDATNFKYNETLNFLKFQCPLRGVIRSNSTELPNLQSLRLSNVDFNNVKLEFSKDSMITNVFFKDCIFETKIGLLKNLTHLETVEDYFSGDLYMSGDKRNLMLEKFDKYYPGIADKMPEVQVDDEKAKDFVIRELYQIESELIAYELSVLDRDLKKLSKIHQLPDSLISPLPPPMRYIPIHYDIFGENEQGSREAPF